MKIAIAGVGDIGLAHAHSAHMLGAEVCSFLSTGDAFRIERFSNIFPSAQPFTTITDFVGFSEAQGCLFVSALPQNIQLSFLSHVNSSSYVLSEKPLALDPAERVRGEKVRVAYNRRFYKWVPQVKSHVSNSCPGSHVRIAVSEQADSEESFGSRIRTNSVHAIDLGLFLLDAHCMPSLNIQYFASKLSVGFVLTTPSKGVLEFSAHMNAPMSHQLEVTCRHGAGIAKPIERFSQFNRIDVQLGESGLRTYTPVEEWSVSEQPIDLARSTSFVAQMKDFLAFTEGAKSATSTVDEAYVTSTIANELANLAGGSDDIRSYR